MPRSANSTREKILDAAYRCFYRDGFYRASVDAIAARAEVTKKTFYYHFDSKDALVGTVLDEQQDHMLRLIETSVAASESDPAEAVQAIFAAFARWAATPGWHGAGFTRIAMELAELPGHPARRAASKHKHAVEAALASHLRRLGVTNEELAAREIVLLLEGANALTLIHDDVGYVERAAAAAAALVGRAAGPSAAARKRGARGKHRTPRLG